MSSESVTTATMRIRPPHLRHRVELRDLVRGRDEPQRAVSEQPGDPLAVQLGAVGPVQRGAVAVARAIGHDDKSLAPPARCIAYGSSAT